MSTHPSLEDTLAEVVTWQMETFPHATPRSQVEHLRREVLELVGDPADAEEMADVLILLTGLAHQQGVDLHRAVRAKMEKNRHRVWGEPDADGVVEHVQPPPVRRARATEPPPGRGPRR